MHPNRDWPRQHNTSTMTHMPENSVMHDPSPAAGDPFGRILGGDPPRLHASYAEFSAQPVDWDLMADPPPAFPLRQRTLAHPVTVQGPGTFLGRATRSLTFEPTSLEGWWFDRADLPETLPVRVSIRNVWTTGQVVSNIVLRSGMPHNYIRLVEHIIALRMGSGIHNLMIRTESGDPPLLVRYGREILEALDAAGAREVGRPVTYLTVRERVTLAGPHGEFLILSPCRGSQPALNLDCAVAFHTAIGRQRVRYPVNDKNFRYGSEARTNTSLTKMLYCKTIGKLFADIRNLGYNRENVLVASRFGYVNKPRLFHDGKSLEAVWHRATLDLLAALALIEEGIFVGDVVSYKAGHRLDVDLIRRLYREQLLTPVSIAETRH
jgi:UDP-3-O-acyl-N-acetylglucosamine deacetylase